jgi:hydrogenase-4 component F
VKLDATTLIWLTLLIPALGALGAALARSTRAAYTVACIAAFVDSVAAAALGVVAMRDGVIVLAAGWLRVDALSAAHFLLLALVGGLSSLFALVYLGDERERNHLSLKQARLFGGLWCGAFFAISLLLVSNNLGIMWVGMEATTLLTAFLISVHVSRESLEAMWKYILICSVAVAFAFMGTLIVAAATPHAESPTALFWSNLLAEAGRLDPRLMRAAFVFLLVGYGTKAGLAPMHNWLPDAHSQAPAPVSALFSGFMLNGALYCILRYIPIVDRATGGTGWPRQLLLLFGIVSLLVGASFILFQHDAKRLLAYCSVEHIGLISVGMGLGGVGVLAALVHTFNHSLAKSLAFFSVGRFGQAFGGHDIAHMSGAFRASRVWGVGLLCSLLALSGAAPFSTFLSEIMILKAVWSAGMFGLFALMLVALGLAFLGLTRHAIRLSWARSDVTPRRLPDRWIERGLVATLVALMLSMGFGWPRPIERALANAAAVVRADKATSSPRTAP